MLQMIKNVSYDQKCMRLLMQPTGLAYEIFPEHLGFGYEKGVCKMGIAFAIK